MSDVVVFGGTLEGRSIGELLNRHGISGLVCVATEYGESLLPERGSLKISHERLSQEEMEAVLRREAPSLVIDATHPYAAVVTENIKEACKKEGLDYIRLLRESQEVAGGRTIFVDSVAEAVDWLEANTSDEHILATTGSKEIGEYTRIRNFEKRVFARVLSLPNVVAECGSLGFCGRNLICMQGPFSLEMNTAMLQQYGCTYLVTKESGTSGGFWEKQEAAARAGARLLLVGRPRQEEGMSLAACTDFLIKKFGLDEKQEITLAGIGMGSRDGMTLEVQKACREAQLLVGAARMVEGLALPGQAVLKAYKPEEIRKYIEDHKEFRRILILLSGDVGFYSGAKKLLEVLPGDVRILPGISSMIQFAARLKMPWEDMVPVSLHGRQVNIVNIVKEHEKVFAIIGSKTGIGDLCSHLTKYGLGQVRVHVGIRLSYEDEEVFSGRAEELQGLEKDFLSVLVIENAMAAKRVVTHGIPDEEFLRDKVPMTKEEIREISLSKLRLTKDALVYDVGAGSGSVSVEMANMASMGHVYAVEKKAGAVELLKKNKLHFGIENLTVIEGLAPEALADLPIPSHAFIGGSSGNLETIIDLLLKKNPKIRLVVNCITLETLMEALACLKKLPLVDVDIAQVSVAKAREVGSYHMMMGLNPVYIISCSGGEKDQ